MRSRSSLWTRWLGAGLASALAVMTLGLTATGQLGLYINPESTWFAVGMAIVVLVGAVASFTLPLGAEDDHGHDHGDEHGHPLASTELPVTELPVAEPVEASRSPGTAPGRIASLTGGIAASVVVVVALALPPASLSAELAMSRDTGAPPLFGGADTVALAKTGDTESFGVGDWSTVFATTTNPESFDGEPVTLTGFVTPAADEAADFALTRLVITHCVIDAQPASLPVSASGAPPATGQWVTVTGVVRARSDGRLVIDATTVEEIPEPEDPYEY